jgi:uncharacterized protein with PIN domain
MILDTSAVLAILRDEPEAPVFAKTVEGATYRRISAVNYVEAAGEPSVKNPANELADAGIRWPNRRAQLSFIPTALASFRCCWSKL